MEVVVENLPWLIAMAVLMGVSGFCSASEAALFSLRGTERRSLAHGSVGQQMAVRLLEDPDRLLSAVLFLNLIVNVGYFAIVSMISLRIEQSGDISDTLVAAFAFGSLLVLIFFSEMFPKSVAVLQARRLCSLIGLPLTLAVRMVDPILPVLRTANVLSRRLVWPGIEEAPYLDLDDLERAVELSTTDLEVADRERRVLKNILSLSDVRVEEWMRPRRKLKVFRPPVCMKDLKGKMTPSGYLLITDPNGDLITRALDLNSCFESDDEDLQRHAEPVGYAPWCSPVADVFQQMISQSVAVVAVVNEHGETIGVVTLEDVYHSILSEQAGRSERLLNRKPIESISPGRWHVIGMTNLKRLARELACDLPATRSVTVDGLVQECLVGFPVVGDQFDWGNLRFTVLEVNEEFDTRLEIVSLLDQGDQDNPSGDLGGLPG